MSNTYPDYKPPRDLFSIQTCGAGCILFRSKRRELQFCGEEPRCQCIKADPTSSQQDAKLKLKSRFITGSFAYKFPSGLGDYRKGIMNQLEHQACQDLFCDGFFYVLRRVELSPADFYLHILIETTAKGVNVTDIRIGALDEVVEKDVMKELGRELGIDSGRMKLFNGWRRELAKNHEGYGGICIAIDFRVCYPDKSVSFGVQMGLPMLEEEMKKRKESKQEPRSWEWLADSLSDTPDEYWARQAGVMDKVWSVALSAEALMFSDAITRIRTII